ncbi:TPA: DNA polymerase III subunit beta [Salmonella enterica subsp. diarizonae]
MSRDESVNDLPGFDITAEDFLRIIEIPCMIIRRTTKMKSLEMLTLRLKGNTLYATGIDLNSAQVISHGEISVVHGDMEASVPAVQINSLIHNMRSEGLISVRCHPVKNQLIVCTGKNIYNIPLCLDPVPEITPGLLRCNYSVHLSAQMLSHIIKRVSHAAASNDVRYYMNGVCLCIEHGQFIAVATNGHRMAVSAYGIVYTDTLPADTDEPAAPRLLENRTVGVILPRSVCPVLHKILGCSKGHFSIDYSDHNLIFNLGNHTVISNLIDGHYPDWRRVTCAIQKNKVRFRINAERLYSALKRASPLLKGGAVNNAGTCIMAFHENTLIIKSPEANSVICREIMDIIKEEGMINNVLEVGINADYLLESLASLTECIKADGAVLIGLDNTATGIISVIINDNHCDFIMPVRI